MMNNDPHKWNRGDTLLSIKDVALIGCTALKECLLDAAAWIDTRLASAIERKEDEL